MVRHPGGLSQVLFHLDYFFNPSSRLKHHVACVNYIGPIIWLPDVQGSTAGPVRAPGSVADV